MTFELKLKPVEKREWGALWVELRVDGTMRVVETEVKLQVPYRVQWHVLFLQPMSTLEFWFTVMGSSTKLEGLYNGARSNGLSTGYLLGTIGKPRYTNVSYKGWMI